MSLWGELKRRNVVRVGVAYVVVAWLVLQVSDTLFPALHLPQWTVTFVAALLVLGFPIALLLSWAYELTPDGLKKSQEVSSTDSIRRTTGRKIDRVIIAVLAIAVVFMAVDNYVLDEPTSDAGAAIPGPAASALNVSPADSGTSDLANDTSAANLPTSTEASELARLPDSVAVLPFANLSPDEENAYFAIGLHDEVLSQLSKLSKLNIISRTSMMRYANSSLSVPEIARELSVETVMEGTVRYAADRIRVTMQLIDAATDNPLWSETYERPFDDIFAIESDIAMNVANALQAEFSVAEQAAIEQEATSDPAAYAIYLQALNPGLSAAERLELFERAIELDPDFASAIGASARIKTNLFVNTTGGSGVSADDRAALEQEVRAMAARALELDPGNYHARAALRAINMRTWRWSDYAAAVEPRDETRLLAAELWAFAWMGQIDRALRIAEKSAAIDPNQAVTYMGLGVVQAYAGDRTLANETLQESLDRFPANALAHAWLAYNHVALGNADSALEELQRTEQLLGNNRQIVYLPELAYSYSRIGRAADVERLFDEMQAIDDPDSLGAGAWATAYLAIGDEARALEQLEIVAAKAKNHEPDQGYLNALNLKMNYLADPRFEQPEFVDVLSRIRGD